MYLQAVDCAHGLSECARIDLNYYYSYYYVLGIRENLCSLGRLTFFFSCKM